MGNEIGNRNNFVSKKGAMPPYVNAAHNNDIP